MSTTVPTSRMTGIGRVLVIVYACLLYTSDAADE